jgi:hypothetical protein
MKIEEQNLNEAENTQLNIGAVSCSFYDFAKNYIRIKDGANERSFNDVELKELEKMQQMMDKGYELRLVHLRKGGKIMWCKKNCN